MTWLIFVEVINQIECEAFKESKHRVMWLWHGDNV